MASSGTNHDRPQGGYPQFTTTHWSVVVSAADSSAPGAQEALEKLCRTYWYPLYLYVRRQGHNSEDAQDLTQAFFAQFLTKESFRHAQRERGKFRSFLLTSLKHFLSHERERAHAAKRGGGQVQLSWDQTCAEERYQIEPASDLTPDKVFDQRWALTLFQQALAALRDEYGAAGKSQQFEQLKRFLSDDPGDGGYASVAATLDMSNSAVAVAVHRLRHRYGELVRQEVAHTVASRAAVQDELRYLIALVSR